MVVVAAAWTVLWAWSQRSPSAISWHWFTDGADALLHTDHLHVYAAQPARQIGPVTFLVAMGANGLGEVAGRTVAQVAMTAAGPLMVLWLAPLVDPTRRAWRTFLAAIAVVPAWTVLSVRWAHLDDVLAMVGAVAAVRAVKADRPVWAGLALAFAIGAKPWAVGFVPVLLVLERGRLKALGTLVLGVAAVWAPFLLADRGTLDGLRPDVPVSDDAGLRILGYRGSRVPAWDRTLELLAGPIAALAAVLRGRWAGLFLVALAVRLAVDPQNLGYQAASIALAAAIFDLLGTEWLVPWTTIVTVVVLWQPFVRDLTATVTTGDGWAHWWFTHPTPVGVSHLIWAVGVVLLVLAAPPRLLHRRAGAHQARGRAAPVG